MGYKSRNAFVVVYCATLLFGSNLCLAGDPNANHGAGAAAVAKVYTGTPEKVAHDVVMDQLKDTIGAKYLSTWKSQDKSVKGSGLSVFERVFKPDFKEITVSGTVDGVLYGPILSTMTIKKTGPLSFDVDVDATVNGRPKKATMKIAPDSKDAKEIQKSIEAAFGMATSQLLSALPAPLMLEQTALAKLLSYFNLIPLADAQPLSELKSRDLRQLLTIPRLLVYGAVYSSLKQSGPARDVDDWEAIVSADFAGAGK